jgi:2-acylglycerol O-acyltransferase 2
MSAEEGKEKMTHAEAATAAVTVDEEVKIRYDASRQGWLSYVVAIVTLGALVGWFYTIAAIVLVCVYNALVHQSLVAVALLVVLFSSTYWPSQILWQDFIDSPIWKTWCEYFSFTVMQKKGQGVSPDKHYIFVEFPHGVFPLGFMLSATIVQQVLTGLRVEGAIASLLFRIPVLAQLCHWFGSRPATTANIHKLLDQGSAGLMAGGIAEIFLSSREHEKVYLKKRKGFVKIALERGAPLVPIYYFGNTQLLDFAGGPAMQKLSRSLRMSLLFFYGRWFLPVPYQVPITMVIGEPMEVEQVDNPTEEQIDQLHARFVVELQKLFDEYKHKVGGNWHNKQLHVV